MQFYEVTLRDQNTGRKTVGHGMYLDNGEPSVDEAVANFQQQADQQAPPDWKPIVVKIVTLDGRTIYDRPLDEN